MKTLTLMLKPASSLCNLDCRYCFYRDLADARAAGACGRMGLDVLEAVVKKAAAEVTDAVQFIFQGGEPLLAGKAFFEAFEELVQRHMPNLRVDRSIQTNGSLIDEEWAAFFHAHDYLVGVSLDGPADLHNALRGTSSGKGSFSSVMAGIRALDRAGAQYNILSVVAEPVARRGAAVYGFLRKSGFDYLQFIPCIDPISGAPAPHSLKPATYGKFLINTFDLYFDELARGKRIGVRWFDNIVAMLAGQPPESCGMSGVCSVNLVIEADGSAYPCDFYAHEDYRLGSILESSLSDLLTSSTATRFVEESPPVPEECQACPVYALCRNGCRRYRPPFLNGVPGKNALCESYRMFFAYAAPRLQALARVNSRNIRG